MLKWCHGLVWTRLNWLLDMVYKGLHLGIISCCCHLRKHLFCCKKGRKYVSGGDLRAYKENTSHRWLICFFLLFHCFRLFTIFMMHTYHSNTILTDPHTILCKAFFVIFHCTLQKTKICNDDEVHVSLPMVNRNIVGSYISVIYIYQPPKVQDAWKNGIISLSVTKGFLCRSKNLKCHFLAFISTLLLLYDVQLFRKDPL